MRSSWTTENISPDYNGNSSLSMRVLQYYFTEFNGRPPNKESQLQTCSGTQKLWFCKSVTPDRYSSSKQSQRIVELTQLHRIIIFQPALMFSYPKSLTMQTNLNAGSISRLSMRKKDTNKSSVKNRNPKSSQISISFSNLSFSGVSKSMVPNAHGVFTNFV